MERHTRPLIQRAPTSGSLHGDQMLRDPRSRRAPQQLDLEDMVSRQTSRESRRPRSSSGRPGSPEGRPFACPYAKHDPHTYSHRNVAEHEYRNCSTGYWTSIARLKQHLYRTHDHSLRCCERCWQNFPNDDQLRRHVQTQSCDPKPMPVEKMDEDQHQAVKERVQGKPVESWYKIYGILFPNDSEPPSPYAEWVTGQDLRDCFELLQQSLPSMLFQAAIARQPQARNTRQESDTVFLTTAELIQRALLRCKREFGQRHGLSHVFASGAPSPAESSAARSDSGAVPASMIRPNPDQPLQRHSQNIRADLQMTRQMRQHEEEEESDDSSDEEMSVDEQMAQSHRHSRFYNVPQHGSSGHQIGASLPYTPAFDYSPVSGAISEEDILQAQRIQDEYLGQHDYDYSQ